MRGVVVQDKAQDFEPLAEGSRKQLAQDGAGRDRRDDSLFHGYLGQFLARPALPPLALRSGFAPIVLRFVMLAVPLKVQLTKVVNFFELTRL